MQRRPIIAGNWKMHGTLASAGALTRAVLAGLADTPTATAVDVWLVPPFPHLTQVADALAGSQGAGVALGAQNLAEAAVGAFTGEVSAAMIIDAGAKVVLVGHSERRALFAEDNALVAVKTAAALAVGLTPVVCVGETLAQRQAGQEEPTVLAQVAAVLDMVGPAGLGALVLAYEPVWAVGTGETATPETAQQMHGVIRQQLAELDPAVAGTVRLLYGGSVKPDNAAALFAQPDIDGALVGGASLDANSFLAICHAAAG